MHVLDQWINKDNEKLTRTFKFNDFVEAFGFLSQVAILAEKQGHHPTIHNTYNEVTLELSTHDAGDVVTEKDEKLAQAINELQ